jgi:hypothetical protein
VRGPLKILKEKWLCENTVISILDYMECFRHKLTRPCEIEQDSLKGLKLRDYCKASLTATHIMWTPSS